MSGPKRDRAEVALRKRFEAEEQQAIDAVARWVGHPAVRGVIEHRRADAERAVAPIGRLLDCQTAVIFFCLHVFGLAGVEPGWELRSTPTWKLTASEVNAIGKVKADFSDIVRMTVAELAEAGAGVVPSWEGDHVVVGQLLLLDVDWELPAREAAEALQPPAIGAIHADASGTVHRRGSGERANNNIGALRRAFERHLHGPPPRAPYAGGGTRALPDPTQRRRQALAKVRERWPDGTASRIYTSFGDHGVLRGGQARTSGGFLRQLLEQDAGPGEIVRCPSKSTLHADLRALAAASAEEKPSG